LRPIETKIIEIRNKLSHDEIEIETSKVKKELIISNEDFQKFKNEVLSLLSLPDNWDGRGSLQIDRSSVIKSLRFLILMDNYNYLTKNNFPEIEGTKEGVSCFPIR